MLLALVLKILVTIPLQEQLIFYEMFTAFKKLLQWCSKYLTYRPHALVHCLMACWHPIMENTK